MEIGISLGLSGVASRRRGGRLAALILGQSEMEYLFNPGPYYRQIAMPEPGPGNLIVYTQSGNGSAPVRTVVNASSVAAGKVNPAMAALSAFLAFARPGWTFVLGDGAVSGTSRRELADDSTDGTDSRLWSDLVSVVSALEAEVGGPVSEVIECWYNKDAADIPNFRDAFWPFYFGVNGDGSPFALGDLAGGRPVHHCLWDGLAESHEKGRGLFARALTRWQILTPMPFHDAPVDPAPELVNFSASGARLSEPARAAVSGLVADPFASSVGLRVGPSAHVCKFGGPGGEIHPDVTDPDGQILLMWPLAFALLRASAGRLEEPEIVGVEAAPDGAWADVLISLPNGGELTTLAQERGVSAAHAAPHQQPVTGFEVSRGSDRRPVFRPDETAYPASHRGTVSIVSASAVHPDHGIVGRVRIVPEQPFAFGDSVSYLRGQATAALLEPRDFDLYPWFLIERIERLSFWSHLYRCPGVAVRPAQEDLPIPVPAPAFTPRSAYFDGASGYASTSISVPSGDRGILSFWMRSAAPSWNDTQRYILDLRVGTTMVLACYTNSNGRLAFRVNNDSASDILSSPTGQFGVGAWAHVALTWAPGGAQLFVNGSLVASTAFGSVDFAGQTFARIGVGLNAAGASGWLGDIGHLYVNVSETLDLSDPANMAKFLNGTDPADLGADGSLPTGSVPAWYFDGDAPNWINNGTAGNVPVSGALVAGGYPTLAVVL